MRFLLALLLLLPATAHAADRRVMVTSFDRVRVEGPYAVTIATGRAPGATITGDAGPIEHVEVRVDGTTLVVRPAADDSRGMATAAGAPVRVTLTTQGLRGAALLGGGTLAVTGSGRIGRLDLSVAGPGAIGWTGVDADQANATVIGSGAITLAGRGGVVRLSVNGSGRIAAEAFDARDLTVRVDGPGDSRARAGFSAAVNNTGLGRVTVTGPAKCRIQNAAGGPVTCEAGVRTN